MSPASSDERVLQALAALGGDVSPGELAKATGLAPRTVGAALDRLVSAGLVGGNKMRRHLTEAGRLGAPSPSLAPVGRFEEAAVACFGETALAAFCRLGADLIAARRLYPEGKLHPALFAFGAPKRGKTVAAQLFARALGLDEARAILQARTLSPKAVFGRRVPTEGGGRRLEPAPHLSLPFFCIDEVGEADEAVRREVQILCHGDRVVAVEDELVTIAGTAMATWNPRDRVDVFPDAYWRRAVTLHVDNVIVPDLRTRMRRVDAEKTGAGTLRLDELRRAVDRLDDACIAILETIDDEEILTAKGRERFELRVLELAVLGRAARHGAAAGEDLRALTWAVGQDWLRVTETVPELVLPSWRVPMDVIAGELADTPGFEDLAAAARANIEFRAKTKDLVTAGRREAAAEDLALAGAREAFTEGIDIAVGKIKRPPEHWRIQAASVRKQLSVLRKKAGEARSRQALDELEGPATPLIAEALRIRRSIDAEKGAEEAERQREKNERKLAAAEQARNEQAFREMQRNAARQRARQLKELRSLRSRLDGLSRRTRPGRDGLSPAAILEQLGAIEHEDVVRERELPPLPGESWVMRRLGREVTPRVHRTLSRVYVDRRGQRWPGGELEQFGSPSLLALLEQLVAAVDAEIATLEGRALVVGPRRLPANF